MRLERIRGRLKGLQVDEEVMPVTAWVGDNGAGKTTRLQLIQWGLLGYAVGETGRALDKRVTGVGLLTGGGESSVTLDFDGGQVLRRGAKQVGESTRGKKLKTDKAPRVLEAALAPWDFLTLSQERQRAAIFSVLPGGGDVSAERLTGWLREQGRQKGVPRAALGKLFKEGFDEFVHGGLEGFRSWLSEQRTALGRDVVRLQGAADCMGEMAAVGHTEEDEDRALKEREVLWSKLRSMEGAGSKVSADLDAVQKRLERAEADLAKARAGYASVKAEVAGLQERRDMLGEVDQTGLEKLRGQVMEATEARVAAENEATQKLAAHRAAESRLEVLVKQAAEFAGMNGPCPTCKRDLSEGREAGEKFYEHALESAEKAAVLAESEATAAREALAKIRAKGEKLSESIRAVQSKAEQADSLDRALKLGAERLEGWQERGREAKAAVKEAGERLKGIEPDSEVPAPEVLEEARRAALAADERLQEIKNARSMRANRRKVSSELEEANRALEAAKLLLEWTGPKGLQGEVVNECLDTLAVAVNEAHYGEEKVVFKAIREDGSPWFDFGVQRGEQFIPWRALSGGEFTRVLTAFLVGMVQHSKPRYRVLVMDGLERITQPDRDGLVTALCDAVAEDRLDQVFLASCEPIEAADLKPPLGRLVQL